MYCITKIPVETLHLRGVIFNHILCQVFLRGVTATRRYSQMTHLLFKEIIVFINTAIKMLFSNFKLAKLLLKNSVKIKRSQTDAFNAKPCVLLKSSLSYSRCCPQTIFYINIVDLLLMSIPDLTVMILSHN